MDAAKEFIFGKKEELDYESLTQCIVCGGWVDESHTCGEKNEK